MQSRNSDPVPLHLKCLICFCLLLGCRSYAAAQNVKPDPRLKLAVRFVSDSSTAKETMFLVELKNISRVPVFIQCQLAIDWSLGYDFRDAQNNLVALWRRTVDLPPLTEFGYAHLPPGKSICQTFLWYAYFLDKPEHGDTVYFRLNYSTGEITTDQGSTIPACYVQSPWIRLTFKNDKIYARPAGRDAPKDREKH